jgi:hypothetical protein
MFPSTLQQLFPTLQQLFEILLQEFNQTTPSALPMNGVSENQASEDDSNH